MPFQCNNVTGEEKYLQTWPGRGSNPRPSALKSNTLPRRHKSRLVPQGSTSVLYTYTLWHSPPPHWNSSSNFWEYENHWKWDSRRFNAQMGYLRWAPNVTGEEKYLQTWPGRGSNPRPSALKSNTLPRRHKSRLVPQGSTSVLYTYHLLQQNKILLFFVWLLVNCFQSLHDF